MRFVLEDKKQRIFIAERFCFKGSIDDWIDIGGPDSLENLLKATQLKDTLFSSIDDVLEAESASTRKRGKRK